MNLIKVKNACLCLHVSQATANFVPMKHFVAIFALFMAITMQAVAQQENVINKRPDDLYGINADTLSLLKMDTRCELPKQNTPSTIERRSYSEARKQQTDSLHLPALTQHGSVPLMSYAYEPLWGIDNWELHRGLNMNLGASVFASFGKGTPSGAGFAQDLSLMYALPLTKRLSLALGGWVSNVFYANRRFTDAGLSAVLGYKFDEHWEASAFVKKSLVVNNVHYSYGAMQDLGDRIGASVKYNFSPSFSVQLTVQAARYNAPAPGVHSFESDGESSLFGNH